MGNIYEWEICHVWYIEIFDMENEHKIDNTREMDIYHDRCMRYGDIYLTILIMHYKCDEIIQMILNHFKCSEID